jgi:hypothetical protein
MKIFLNIINDYALHQKNNECAYMRVTNENQIENIAGSIQWLLLNE